MRASPEVWGKTVVALYDSLGCDAVIVERQFGGDMAAHTVRAAAVGRHINIKMVNASRGKAVRAEPIAALMSEEQGKIRLAGRFDELEEQMAGMSTHGYVGEGSPDALDAAIWCLTELLQGIIAPRRISQPTPGMARALDLPNIWSA
jgi:phage terminase large subunit-like protein